MKNYIRHKMQLMVVILLILAVAIIYGVMNSDSDNAGLSQYRRAYIVSERK